MRFFGTLGIDLDRPRPFRDLAIIYVCGSLVAVTLFLVTVIVFGDFSAAQVVFFILGASLLLPIYVVVDLWLIWRQTRFLQPAGPIEGHREGHETLEQLADNLRQTFELPTRSITRIMTVHGPLASLAVALSIPFAEWLLDQPIPMHAKLAMVAIAVFFATPAHAFFEYFAIKSYVTELLRRYPDQETLEARFRAMAFQQGRIGNRVFTLSVFLALQPIIFVTLFGLFNAPALEMLFNGDDRSQVVQTWIAAGFLVLTSAAYTVAGSYIISTDIARRTSELLDVMRHIAANDLDVRAPLADSDEYALLSLGVNSMIDGLRADRMFTEATMSVSQDIKLDSLLARLMEAASELLEAERASVFVHDPRTDTLWSQYGTGLDKGTISFPANAGIAGSVFTSRQPLIIPDAYADARFNKGFDQATGFRTRNIVCAPIIDRDGTPVGVTQVINKRNGAFGPDDLRRLEAFSSQISVSLSNARLFNEVIEGRNYRENILASTSDAIITMDMAGRLVSANARTRSLFGDSDAEVEACLAATGHGMPGLRDQVLEALAQKASRQLADVEMVRTSTGTPVVCNVKIDPLRNSESAVIGAIVTLEDQTEETRLRTSMSRYVPPHLVDDVIAGGIESLGGRSADVVIMFSDIRGFTTLAEDLTPPQVVDLLNTYHGAMVDQLFDHDGMLDKFMGDGLMALFGVPLSTGREQQNGVNAALAMRRALQIFNDTHARRFGKPLEMGIGVHFGPVVVGNIGSMRRMEYTAVGDCVNAASRIESLNKEYGTEIIISETVFEGLDPAALEPHAFIRELDLIRPKGKARPMRIFEVGTPERYGTGQQARERADAFNLALALYRAGMFSAAEAGFAALAADPADRAAARFRQRCGILQSRNVPEGWDGVFEQIIK